MSRVRKVDATGRSVGKDSHARFYFWEWQSQAFQSLSPVARCLLLELKLLHTGRNNGSLFLSVREAARRIGTGKNQASQAFVDLQDRGFIRPNVLGAFNLKSGARRGMATSWVLTEYSIGEAMGAGSRDFMRWTPPTVPAAGTPKKIRRSRGEDTLSPLEGHPVPAAGTPPPKLSLVRGHFEPKPGSDGARSGDTVKLPVLGEEAKEALGDR